MQSDQGSRQSRKRLLVTSIDRIRAIWPVDVERAKQLGASFRPLLDEVGEERFLAGADALSPSVRRRRRTDTVSDSRLCRSFAPTSRPILASSIGASARKRNGSLSTASGTRIRTPSSAPTTSA